MNKFLKELTNFFDKHGFELVATDEGQIVIEPTYDSKLIYEPIYFEGDMTAEKLRRFTENEIEKN